MAARDAAAPAVGLAIDRDRRASGADLPLVASIGAEYFMTVGPGIGGFIIAGRERFQMDLVIFRILVLGLVGFLINRGASAIETRLLRWRPS
jgi:ABC-type nitrate/sulfonate/bicarbonate transport system permease component